MTPWSTQVEVLNNLIRIKVMLSTDAGPAREFKPFLDVDLDDAHAMELLCELHRALTAFRLQQQGSRLIEEMAR